MLTENFSFLIFLSFNQLNYFEKIQNISIWLRLMSQTINTTELLNEWK